MPSVPGMGRLMATALDRAAARGAPADAAIAVEELRERGAISSLRDDVGAPRRRHARRRLDPRPVPRARLVRRLRRLPVPTRAMPRAPATFACSSRIAPAALVAALPLARRAAPPGRRAGARAALALRRSLAALRPARSSRDADAPRARWSRIWPHDRDWDALELRDRASTTPPPRTRSSRRARRRPSDGATGRRCARPICRCRRPSPRSTQQLGASSARNLRRRAKKLEAEVGPLTLERVDGSGRGALDAILDEGFALEAAGWKGERGTAIACDPAPPPPLPRAGPRLRRARRARAATSCAPASAASPSTSRSTTTASITSSSPASIRRCRLRPRPPAASTPWPATSSRAASASSTSSATTCRGSATGPPRRAPHSFRYLFAPTRARPRARAPGSSRAGAAAVKRLWSRLEEVTMRPARRAISRTAPAASRGSPSFRRCPRSIRCCSSPSLEPPRPLALPARSLESPEAQLFYLARAGVHHDDQALARRGDGGIVLMPAYHHGVEVEAVRAAGAARRLLPRRRATCASTSTTCASARSARRARHLCHPLRRLRAAHRRGARHRARARRRALRGLRAGALLARRRRRAARQLRRRRCFCLYKTLPVPHGGLLVARPTCRSPTVAPPPLVSTLHHVAGLALAHLELHSSGSAAPLRQAARAASHATVDKAVATVKTGTMHLRRDELGLGASQLVERLLPRFDAADGGRAPPPQLPPPRRRARRRRRGRRRAAARPACCPLFLPVRVAGGQASARSCSGCTRAASTPSTSGAPATRLRRPVPRSRRSCGARSWSCPVTSRSTTTPSTWWHMP